MSEKLCESCGMPMVTPSDFGGANTSNSYCKYCTLEDGTLKDFETKFEETVHFIGSRMNVDREVAIQMAKNTMRRMPAWQGYFHE